MDLCLLDEVTIDAAIRGLCMLPVGAALIVSLIVATVVAIVALIVVVVSKYLR